MAKISRDRGAKYEREVAQEFRDYGYDAYRTAQHMGKTGQAPDIVVPGMHAECKRRRKIAAYEWVHQAEHDAAAEGKGNHPVVFCRADGEKTLAIMPIDVFMDLYREWRSADDLQKNGSISETTRTAPETKETAGDT